MTLTPRQTQIIRLISSGKSTKMIADELKISVNTVEMHRDKIVLRLGCGNMYQAVAKFTKGINGD